MKYSRAWHLWCDDEGNLVPRGGHRVTTGVTRDGQVWLETQVRLTRLGPEALAALARHLTDASFWARVRFRAGPPG